MARMSVATSAKRPRTANGCSSARLRPARVASESAARSSATAVSDGPTNSLSSSHPPPLSRGHAQLAKASAHAPAANVCAKKMEGKFQFKSLRRRLRIGGWARTLLIRVDLCGGGSAMLLWGSLSLLQAHPRTPLARPLPPPVCRCPHPRRRRPPPRAHPCSPPRRPRLSGCQRWSPFRQRRRRVRRT